MTNTSCVGVRHYSNSINIVDYEIMKPKTEKIVRARKSQYDLCGRKSQITSK